MKPIHPDRALEHLLHFLAIEGLSGREQKISDAVRQALLKAGCKAAWIKSDQAHKIIPHDFTTGNLIVKLPGTVKAPRIMFSGHLDTVPLCRGAQPVVKGNRILPKGKTGLGGDDRTAVACLVHMTETLLQQKLPHPPITLLFTVGEETGLWGARTVKLADLGRPVMGFNFDGGDPNCLTTGATGADRWEVDIHGISSHAGVHPEDGVSATLIAARAVADIKERGYWGLIEKGNRRGTSNIGIIQGGEATNQVTDHVYVKGESRSHRASFLEQITRQIETSFARAARATTNAAGQCGRITFKQSRDYRAFTLPSSMAVVRRAISAGKRIGLAPRCVTVNGGLDANYFNEKGLPTVTLGAGQHNIHTVKEYVDIREFLKGCKLALALATKEE